MSDDFEDAQDEANAVNVLGPVKLVFDLDGLTRNELEYIKNSVEGFVEVVGGDITVLEELGSEDGTEETNQDE